MRKTLAYPQKSVENGKLRLERERRGWSLNYVATRISCPDPHTVGRWERGIFLPSPRYRQALCELYGKDARELGFLDNRANKGSKECLEQSQPEQAEQQLTHANSCFFFNTKLPHTDELFGRKSECEILLNRIAHGSSTSLVGPRRIGKTWLLEYLLFNVPRQLGNSFRIGYLDAMMASCSTIAGFTSRAARTWGLPLSTEWASRGLAALEEVIETLHARGLHMVLCIDEFDFLGIQSEFNLNFFASLRALAQGNLSLVIASKRPLIDIVGDFDGTSDFFNVFEQIVITPFNQKDAEDFVQRKALCAHFSDREREALLKYGRCEDDQWLPLRLQLAGKMLFEDKARELKRLADSYHTDDPNYWQCFEQRLEEKYRGVIKH